MRRVNVPRVRVVQAAAILVLVLGAGSAVHAVRGPAPDFATRYAGGVVTGRDQNPYDASVIDPAERTLVGYQLAYPFVDPPPVAWGFRAVALIPYAAAKVTWFLLILLCSVVCVACTVRMVGWRLRGPTLLLVALVVSIGFGPLREGLVLLQLDPLMGALALAAFLYARTRGTGLLYAIATLKPQGIVLGAVGASIRGRAEFVAWLLAGWAALVGVTALVGHPTWRGWVHQVLNLSSAHGALKVTLAVVGAVIVLVGSIAVWRRLSRSTDPGLAAFAIGACVTGRVPIPG
jgi:hypothetical protein